MFIFAFNWFQNASGNLARCSRRPRMSLHLSDTQHGLLEEEGSALHPVQVPPGDDDRRTDGQRPRREADLRPLQPVQGTRLEVRGSIRDSPTDLAFARLGSVQAGSDQRLWQLHGPQHVPFDA